MDIRAATVADLALLGELRRGLSRHAAGSIEEARERVVLRELISRPELGFASLITSCNTVAGYVIVTYCFSIEFVGRFALIDELFLLEPFRGQGIGGKVLGRLTDTLRQTGISAARLEVERANLGAVKLYRRQGFEPHDRHLMTKWLDPGSGQNEMHREV